MTIEESALAQTCVSQKIAYKKKYWDGFIYIYIYIYIYNLLLKSPTPQKSYKIWILATKRFITEKDEIQSCH